jgi:hypothetical protein
MPLNINPDYLFLAGIILVILTLMIQLRSRSRKAAQQKAQRQAEVRAARQDEAKKKAKAGEVPKSAVGRMPSSDRLPLGDPLGIPFAGTAMPKNIAQWEMEFHTLGREIIGRIDSKMVALQTLTLEANRSANRLEILIEHLEQIYRRELPESSGDEQPAADKRNVIPISEAAEQLEYAEPLADMLDELSGDIENIHKEIAERTTLHAADGPVAILEPAAKLEATPVPRSLSLESLYHQPAKSDGTLRQEIELLSDYGYDVKQIAASLDITPGEVDLVLNLRSNTAPF